MKNELFSIGGFTIHAYGLMIAIGIYMAYIVSDYRAKKKDWTLTMFLVWLYMVFSLV